MPEHVVIVIIYSTFNRTLQQGAFPLYSPRWPRLITWKTANEL